MRDHHFDNHGYGHSARNRGTGRDMPVQHQARPPDFNMRVFDQNRYWFDADGEVFEIADLRADSRRDLVEWLYRNATYFHLRVVFRELSAALRTNPGHMPPVATQLAPEWLSQTVLMKALKDPGTSQGRE